MVAMLRSSLDHERWEEHHQILRTAADMLLQWRDSVLPPLYLELRSDVLNDPQTYRAVISEFLSDQISRAHTESEPD
jgi:hypothetical protein